MMRKLIVCDPVRYEVGAAAAFYQPELGLAGMTPDGPFFVSLTAVRGVFRHWAISPNRAWWVLLDCFWADFRGQSEWIRWQLGGNFLMPKRGIRGKRGT